MSAQGDESTLTELVFLHRGPLAARGAVVLLVAVGAGVAGVLLADAHLALAARADVASLNPVQRLLRSGSSAATAWPGWVAAAFFLFSMLRMRRGPVEPAPGRKPVATLTPTDLRRGLRAEYRAARLLLCVVLVIAAVDCARTIATALDVTVDLLPGGVLLPTGLEALGYVAAGAVLGLWARRFAVDLRQLGALT